MSNDLCHLAFLGDARGVSVILRQGADPNGQGASSDPECAESFEPCSGTPLIFAASKGRTGVVKILLDAGANPNNSDRLGLTPLIWTTNCECVAILITRGADINRRTLLGKTALMYAVLDGNVSLTQCMIVHGAKVDEVDDNGRTALFMAMDTKISPDLATLLISKGADVNVKDHSGKSVLDIATSQNDPRFIRLLRSVVKRQ
jgi:ankyrin repeat protein